MGAVTLLPTLVTGGLAVGNAIQDALVGAEVARQLSANSVDNLSQIDLPQGRYYEVAAKRMPTVR